MGSEDSGDQPGQPRWCGMVWGMLVMHPAECTCLTASSRRPARTAGYSSLLPNNSCCIRVTSHTSGELFARTEPSTRPSSTCPSTKHMSLCLLVCLVIMATNLWWFGLLSTSATHHCLHLCFDCDSKFLCQFCDYKEAQPVHQYC